MNIIAKSRCRRTKKWSAHVEQTTFYQCFDAISDAYGSSHVTAVGSDSYGDIVLSDDGGRDEITIGLVVTDTGKDASLVCHAIDAVIALGIVGTDKEHLHSVEVTRFEILFLECEAETAHAVRNVRSDEGDIGGQTGQALCLAHALVAAPDDENGSPGEGQGDGKIIQSCVVY